MQRTVCFIDFNSYFASVEQHANPLLRGKPIAVIASMTDTTCCLAARREAKRFGIKTGTAVGKARARCPGLVLVLSDICGIGANMHERLKIHCIRTIKALQEATSQQLRALW